MPADIFVGGYFRLWKKKLWAKQASSIFVALPKLTWKARMSETSATRIDLVRLILVCGEGDGGIG
ncbi:hypothetical protein A0126_01230 [Exiguobacterium sp. N4-1P]|nr:hypothetical protein A0126_01230 [Exiguobacterium sp. N4-1P]